MEHPDAIAILLAARHDPAICDLADHQKAQALLEADAGLQALFEEERQYYDQHQDLLANVRLPEGVRASMREQIRAAQAEENKIIAWPKSLLPLAAAAVVLITVGGFLAMQLRSGTATVVQTGSGLESLQSFAADQVAQRALDLDQYSDQSQELLAWLNDQGAPAGDKVPDSLQGLSTMGCKVYDWGGHHVALVCFRTANDQVVHLFIANRDDLHLASAEPQAGARMIHNRETQSWVDARHAYVMVAHDEGQSLGGLSG